MDANRTFEATEEGLKFFFCGLKCSVYRSNDLVTDKPRSLRPCQQRAWGSTTERRSRNLSTPQTTIQTAQTPNRDTPRVNAHARVLCGGNVPLLPPPLPSRILPLISLLFATNICMCVVFNSATLLYFPP
jgi:hypothetical protein